MFKSKTGMYLYIGVIVLLAVILVIIAGAALSPGISEYSAENNKTELSVFTSVGDYTEKYSLLNEAADSYMSENPNISVSCSTLSDEDFNIRLQTDFAGGCQPDIIITYPTAAMRTMFERGLLADLTPEFESDSLWYDSFDKSVLQFCESDGRIFAAPTETEHIVLYANRKILDRFGLAVPKTYADLKNCISVLSAGGITPFAFGLKDENLFLYQALTAAMGGSAEIENAIETGTFSDSYNNALMSIKELYSLGAFGSGFASMNRMEAQQMFIGQNAAFIVESSAFAGYIENSMQSSEIPDTFTVLAFPTPGSYYSSKSNPDKNFYPVIYGAGDMTIFVSQNAYSNKHDAIMDYIKYLTSSKVTSKFVSRAKFISALKNRGTVQKNGPLITECLILTINTAEFTPSPANVIDSFIWGHTVAGSFEDMLLGSVSPKEITAEAQRLAQLCEREGD